MRRALKALWFVLTGLALVGWSGLTVHAAAGGEISRSAAALAFGLLAGQALIAFAGQITNRQKEKLS